VFVLLTNIAVIIRYQIN